MTPELPPAFFLTAAALYGAVIGSFLNVCIYRLPRGLSVVRPRSACPRCSAPIPWYRNLPVVSWVLLRGRAACCGAPIAFRYVFVEALTAGVAVLVVHQTGLTVETLARFVFLAALIVLFYTDLDLRLLPDAVTLTMTGAGLALSFLRETPSPLSAFTAAALGFGLLLGIAALWRRLRKIEAVGGGDIKMLAMMGAFLGLAGMFVALFLASVMGAIVGCAIAGTYALERLGPLSSRGGRLQGVSRAALAGALFARGLRRKTVPFGCFLSIGSAAAVFFGRPIAEWYIGLVSF